MTAMLPVSATVAASEDKQYLYAKLLIPSAMIQYKQLINSDHNSSMSCRSLTNSTETTADTFSGVEVLKEACTSRGTSRTDWTDSRDRLMCIGSISSRFGGNGHVFKPPKALEEDETQGATEIEPNNVEKFIL